MFRNSLKMLLGGKANRKSRNSSDGGSEEVSDLRSASLDPHHSFVGQGSSIDSECAFEGDYDVPPLSMAEGLQHMRIMEGVSRSLPSSPLLAHQTVNVRLQPVKKISTGSATDEEQDSDDERLYFEERLDPAEDIISEENVDASLLSSPAPAATLSPSFDARTGARSNENNKENVAATRSPSSDTRMRAHSNATGNKKENVSASPLPLPSPATHTHRRSLSVIKATETNVCSVK